jgi:5-methylcytosine-specific restriction endonuclease McrA
MTDILNKTIVLVLNRNWQAINIRTPQEAFCQMAANVATGLDITGENHTWENLVWSAKDVNTRKGNRLPHEAGLKLLSVPRAPKELPVTALLRNPHGLAEWKLFLNDKA